MAVLLIVLLIGIYSGAVVIGGKGVTGGSQTVTASDGDLLSKDVINKLDNLADQINADYYEDVDQEDLINGMYKGLFEGIGDPYSEYYTPEEYEDIMISTHANYYGIGAGLTQDKNTMEVSVTHGALRDPPPNAPEARAKGLCKRASAGIFGLVC